MKLAPKHLALATVALSAVLLYTSGEGCLRFEHQRYLNYANPIYLFIVSVSLVSVAVGSFVLIWIFKKVNGGENEK